MVINSDSPHSILQYSICRINNINEVKMCRSNNINEVNINVSCFCYFRHLHLVPLNVRVLLS